MKKIIFLLIFVLLVFNNPIFSQNKSDNSKTEKSEEGTCPAPKAIDYKALCADIGSKAKVPASEAEFYEYTYEKRMWTLSCANPTKDSEEKAKEKIAKMWSKYQKQFKCDSVDFGVQNGNVLKFSLSQNMPGVIETFASTYGLDINFVDPADNMNVLDYVNSEIKRLTQLQNTSGIIAVYEQYKEALIGLGAKTSKP